MYSLMARCPHCGGWHVGGGWYPKAERPCAWCGYRIVLATLAWHRAERRR
jgi:uncharacterized protein (DUF983 family)